MKSKLIRILIILCVIGVVTFGVVAFLVNHNVEQKAYSEIATIRNNTNFEKFYKNADNTKSKYGGDQCPYVKYVNDATKDLNTGIDYYLNYLQNMSGMNKNGKTALVDKYRDYISAINEAKVARSKYDTFNSKPSPTDNDKKQIAIQSANFARTYLLAYGKGYQFFSMLQDIVDSKVFGGNMYKNYTLIKYEMESVFVNQSINKLVGELEKKMLNKSFSATPAYASTAASNYNILHSKEVSSSLELKSSSYANFINNYNKITDVRAFLADSKTYIANNDKEVAARDAKNFLSSTFGLNMEGSN